MEINILVDMTEPLLSQLSLPPDIWFEFRQSTDFATP
jgi:hypothetical protein